MNPMNSNYALLGREQIIERLIHKDPDKRILIKPLLSSKQIQPASLDLRLGPEFAIIKIGKITHLDPLKKPIYVKREVKKYTDFYKILGKHERFILHPNEFVLATTLEYIKLPLNIAGRLEGRSSWGRLGILIHITAGYIDPGYCGNITFELKNAGKIPIPLYPGVRIGQISFFNVNNTERYCGKYQDSFGLENSKFFDDEEYEKIRNRYGEEYYEGKITEILECVENNSPTPISESDEKFPQILTDSIVNVYKRKIEGETEDEK
jgi:dCTP deaminase